MPGEIRNAEAIRELFKSRVQEAQNVFFILLAERSSNSHMTDDRPRDMWRKALRGRVASAAVLCELPFTVALMYGTWTVVFGRSGTTLPIRWCTATLREKRR